MKNILLFSCTLFLFSSCKNKNEQYILNSIGVLKRLCPDIVNDLKDVPVVHISLSSSYQNGIDSPQTHISATANMPPTNALDSFFVNGIHVPHKRALKKNLTSFSSDSFKPKRDEKSKDFHILFGQETDVYFNSQELGSITGALKIFEPIKLKVNDSENSSVDFSRSRDMKITWNKDSLSKNPVRVTLVELKFPDFSSKLTEMDTSKTILQIQKLVDDNGILYIKSSELQTFHEGSNYLLTVMIMRGSYTMLKTSKGKKALLSAMSQSSLTLNQVR